MIRLFFIDDHPVISAGLAARYRGMEGFDVVGTAASVRAALERAVDVDVCVVDVQLEEVLSPGDVKALSARTSVVLFSARAGEPLIKHLLAAGAAAVLNKAAPLEALDALLRDVHAGRSPQPSVKTTTTTTTALALSAREVEVYRGLARCLTPKEIAAELGIARSTVYCHIDRVREKLGVSTLQEIVAHALVDRA
ncbi:MAG: LuxR C-terminal-related transcriptional regulator [Deltaproteobacteria bacterium]|nr:LuxR C-terminal-related transcriptional regulator [Deltaproteobacteria bacterium]